MSIRFNRTEGLIIVPVRLWGKRGSGVLPCALDTGSTDTLISAAALDALGYDLVNAVDHVQLTTASGAQLSPQIVVQKLRALGNDRQYFPVLGHTLPSSAGVDGLLGLDFLRGLSLTVDFRAGEIMLG
jgi:predicted aspartyl protease